MKKVETKLKMKATAELQKQVERELALEECEEKTLAQILEDQKKHDKDKRRTDDDNTASVAENRS